MAIVLRVWFRHLSLKFIASSTAPAVNSLLEWVQQNKAYDIRDTIDYSNSNMHSTAGAVERVKPLLPRDMAGESVGKYPLILTLLEQVLETC